MRSLALALVLFAIVPSVEAREEHRSQAALDEFQRHNACPSTGLFHKQKHHRCPGYVIDHINPICHGGPDHWENMQWQSIAPAKKKDEWERQLCRGRLSFEKYKQYVQEQQDGRR